MNTNKSCPRCGNPLGNESLEGLCPECMLVVAMDTSSLAPEEAGVQSGMTPPPLRNGEQLGRYRLRRKLGEGGMGVVYEAEEEDSGRRVALKILRQQLDSPQDRARFLREGRMAASINHPNCVYVFGTEEIEGTPVIAMEYIGGTTLAQRLACDGPLPTGRAVDAMLEIIAGLEAAQAGGILHRDIKPSNCFEDSDGRVKIGDFGLSISTLPRAETMITEAGTLVGTPAFCSPEQLRGDELGVRADMYSLGVTLYQLLTGRLPFEGKTMPQLIANTLEKRPPSPRQFRQSIPAGLARAILRCLEKQPSDRFRSYADLRRALEPYAAAAPRPATLGLRFLAGVIDTMLLGALGQVVVWLVYGNPFTALDQMVGNLSRAWQFVVPAFALSIAYFSLMECRWGATVGKTLCRLRVVRPGDRANPHFKQALIRAACYQIIPVIPFWIMAFINQDLLFAPSAGNYALSGTYYLLLAALFSTARRANGFAAVQDLLSGTRIISRAASASRSVAPMVDSPLDTDASTARIGPYHVLRPLPDAIDARWVEGYDLRLLRRVLIRIVPPGTPPLPTTTRTLSRIGRLRWLTGRREGDEHWDAFEGIGGDTLTDVAAQPQPWERVRYWVQDLAEELQAAERDGSLPVLALDRVWITRDGRAKIFDVAVPGSRDDAELTSQEPVAFLDQVAAVALGGVRGKGQTAANAGGPLPLHARKFLDTLPSLQNPESVALALHPLLRRFAEVGRMRRATVVAICLAFPLVAGIAGLLSTSLLQNWQQENPEVMALNQLLGTWKAKSFPFVPKDSLPSERLIGIYIADHYREFISDESRWSSALCRSMISGKARTFAEESVVTYAGASEEERTEAARTLAPIVRSRQVGDLPAAPRLLGIIFLVTFVVYVALPAIIAALLFRGGLALAATGITFVRRDGRKASRLRLFWRALVSWAPMIGVVILSITAVDSLVSIAWPMAAGVLLALLTAGSLLLPVRGLPDRLAGTWPVPR